jgi:hypothetical protein
MVLGDASKVVNAQNVTITVGAEGEVITLYDCSLIDESFIDRRNPRSGPIDTPSFSLIEIVGKCVISKALYTYFRTLRQLSTRGALPTDTISVIATNIGVSADDFTDSGTYILRRMASIAQERGRYEVELTIRMKGTMTLS